MRTNQKITLALILGFLLLNISAAFHAYRFTHFSSQEVQRSELKEMSLLEKLGILFFGVSNPRLVNQTLPTEDYETLLIESGEETLSAWRIEVDSANGEVILFHGYAGTKSSMLAKARLIRKMGFNTTLVDFRGSGESTGHTTTIGYRESEDVRSAVDFVKKIAGNKIYVLGSSMGAVSILKAAAEPSFGAQRIIVECPFSSLLQTSKNRFESMGVPAFPAAHLLVFWGGLENGFWGFSHDVAGYSEAVTIPTMIIYGERDARVRRFEMDHIHDHLAGEKELLIFPQAGHGDYLIHDSAKWVNGVEEFLGR